MKCSSTWYHSIVFIRRFKMRSHKQGFPFKIIQQMLIGLKCHPVQPLIIRLTSDESLAKMASKIYWVKNQPKPILGNKVTNSLHANGSTKLNNQKSKRPSYVTQKIY